MSDAVAHNIEELEIVIRVVDREKNITKKLMRIQEMMKIATSMVFTRETTTMKVRR